MHGWIDDAEAGFQGVRVDLFVGMDLAQFIQQSWSRYFTEDAPYGLVPWSHIGKAVGVETPVIDSIVNLYSVVHERNWWDQGRSAADLGLAGMSVQQIKHYVTTGKRAT
jgi:hypothetical protein